MTSAGSFPGRRGSTTAANVYLVFAGAFVLWSAVFTLLFQFDVLVRDQWHVYVDFFRLPFWEALWKDQNSHRLVFPNLFFYLDNYAFQGTNVFLQLCILGMNAATGCLLLSWGGRDEPADRQLTKICCGFVFVLLFWLANRVSLAWGLGVHYYLPALMAVTACRLLASVGPGRPDRRSPMNEHLKVGSAIVCGVITTFSFGIGISIWPTLILLALWLKLRLAYLTAILTTGVIAVGVYVLNLPPGKGVPGTLFSAPWKYLAFMGVFAGSPVAHALGKQRQTFTENEVLILAAAGSITVLVALFLGGRQLVRKTVVAPTDAFHLAVVFFVLGSSLVIALGRLEDFGISTALSGRHLIWALLLWAAVFAAAPRICARLGSRWRPATGLMGLVVVVLTILMLPRHYAKTVELGYASNRATEAGLSLIVGVEDEVKVRDWLYRLTPVVQEVASVLRKNRWNLFSDQRLDLLKGPLPHSVRTHTQLPCRGELTEAVRLPGGEGDWRIKGWAWQEQLHTPPRYILLTTDADEVRGLAQFTGGNLSHAEAQEIYRRELRYSILRRFSNLWPSLLRWDLGWYGYVKGAPDLCDLNVYGLFDDGSACTLPKVCDEIPVSD